MNEQQQQRADAVNAAAVLLTERETKGAVEKGLFSPARDGEARIEGILTGLVDSGESLASASVFVETIADYIYGGGSSKSEIVVDESGIRIENVDDTKGRGTR